MYICSCFAVTDHQIRAHVKAGCKTWKELVRLTNVCTNCGICGQHAKEIFDKAIADQQALAEQQAIAIQESQTQTTAAGCCGGDCHKSKGTKGA